MRFIRVAGAAVAALVSITSAHAAPTGEQQCLSAKAKAIAKYESCIWKTHSKADKTGTFADIALCDTKFDAAWAKPDPKFGSDCPDATAATIKAMIDGHVQELRGEIETALGQCNVHTQDCPDGLACYPGGLDETVCAAPGTTPEGGACTQPNECMEGFVCVNTGGGGQCREICQPSAPQCSVIGRLCASFSGFADTGACI